MSSTGEIDISIHPLAEASLFSQCMASLPIQQQACSESNIFRCHGNSWINHGSCVHMKMLYVNWPFMLTVCSLRQHFRIISFLGPLSTNQFHIKDFHVSRSHSLIKNYGDWHWFLAAAKTSSPEEPRSSFLVPSHAWTLLRKSWIGDLVHPALSPALVQYKPAPGLFESLIDPLGITIWGPAVMRTNCWIWIHNKG